MSIFQKVYLKNRDDVMGLPLEIRWQAYIAREYFLTIPITDNRDELVDESFLTSNGIVIDPIWNDAVLDEEGVAYQKYFLTNKLKGWLRSGAAERLVLAGNSLKDSGYQLVLRAGYRPVEVQLELFREVKEGLRVQNPKLTDGELTELTRDFVSDPSQIVPPHTAGAAVDVVLLDNLGKLVDMGCPMNAGDDLAWSNNTDITANQTENRAILRNAMLDAGFAPLGSEWWHFSYGDQVWAAYYDQASALYGIVV